MSDLDQEACPICLVPFEADDLCATDITEGTCHAACLEGSPVVSLDTGEPTDGEPHTYRFGDPPQPTPAPCYCGGDRASGHAAGCPASQQEGVEP